MNLCEWGLDEEPAADDVHPAAVLTLVIWVGCVLVGLLGFILHYERPCPAPLKHLAVLAVPLRVDLVQAARLPPDPAPITPQAVSPPPLRESSPMLPVARFLPVEQPSPVIAFPLPVEGASRLAPEQPVADQPAPGPATAAPAAVTQAPVQSLVFGAGEGKQPAPEYPLTAQRAGQEGTVRVRFTVGPDGRVLAAESAQASPWPLLNEAAVRVVREQWRFRTGSVRRYEVAIRFELVK